MLSFQFEEENDVIIMTDDNFEALIAENGPTFVEFYAPVCLHPATAIVLCVSRLGWRAVCFSLTSFTINKPNSGVATARS